MIGQPGRRHHCPPPPAFFPSDAFLELQETFLNQTSKFLSNYLNDVIDTVITVAAPMTIKVSTVAFRD